MNAKTDKREAARRTGELREQIDDGGYSTAEERWEPSAEEVEATAGEADNSTRNMPHSCSMWCSWNIFNCFSKLFSRMTTLTNCF